jgi:Arc/MetJ family transcription regulator
MKINFLWRSYMTRTVIDIDDKIFSRAQALTGLKKKVDVVNYALKKLVEQKEIEKILDLKGKVTWEGDLGETRRDRIDCR